MKTRETDNDSEYAMDESNGIGQPPVFTSCTNHRRANSEIHHVIYIPPGRAAKT